MADDAVAAAFAATPRADFLPDTVRDHAAHDGPLAIGHGQTNSQPRTVETMLRLLEVRPGHRVLDVGTGSGWTTALLAHLTGPGGSVVGTEIVPELVEMGRTHLARCARPWASITRADPEVPGDPGRAPYDRVLVSAGASELPEALVAQLADGGRMVIPVAGQMLVVDRRGEEVVVRREGHYRFVPLV
ncbi:protein-L-isoaspartate O-methyltransferase family protein [Nocardioides sp. SYSU DS0663]|uniref:protein-L-isoaspartate O-methyltransferase family protein n=1 Tax=Nocardioides sp. SYSU DS0663 TaxID=3416445 RepID=UPI003F4B45C3